MRKREVLLVAACAALLATTVAALTQVARLRSEHARCARDARPDVRAGRPAPAAPGLPAETCARAERRAASAGDAPAGSAPAVEPGAPPLSEEHARTLVRFAALLAAGKTVPQIQKEDPGLLADLLQLQAKLDSGRGPGLLGDLLPLVFAQLGIHLSPAQQQRVRELAADYPLTFDYPDLGAVRGAITGVLRVDSGLREILTPEQYDAYAENRDVFFFNVLRSRTVRPIRATGTEDAFAQIVAVFEKTFALPTRAALEPIVRSYLAQYIAIEQAYAGTTDPLRDLEMKVKLIDLQLETEAQILSAYRDAQTTGSKEILVIFWSSR